MTLRTFLRLYVISALMGAAGLWVVAAASERDSRYARGSLSGIGQCRTDARLADKGTGNDSHCELLRATTQTVPVALSHGVRHVPATRTVSSLLEDARGSLGKAKAIGVAAAATGSSPDRSVHHLRALATNAAHLCGVDPALFHRLIARESSWDPLAVSSSGAVGLGQIKPSTLWGVSPSLNPWEPWDNLLGSACYLRQLKDRFGSWSVALHAYHAGPTAVVEGTVSDDSRRYAAQIGGGR